jgi:crotonobetainyl-CoA:carnitine CoA-transferase CaiB-like acyl-CoA transferase
VEDRAALVRNVADTLRTRNASDWLARFGRAGVPAGVVRTVPEALAEVDADPTTGVAPPAPGRVRLAPPRLDQHGADVRARGWRIFDDLK